MGAVMTKDTTTNQNDFINPQWSAQVERSTVSYKKKLLQPRFSRRRFLRDYRGTNLLTVIVLFIVTGMNIGTISPPSAYSSRRLSRISVPVRKARLPAEN